MTNIITTSPITAKSLLAQTKELRAEGRHEEADAILLSFEGDLARKAEQLANVAHKATRKARLELADKVDPEKDDEVAKAIGKLKVRMLAASIIVPGIVDPAPYAACAVNKWAHTDGGPAAKGQAAPPFRLFQRIIESVDAADAAKAIESKLDGRMNQIHHWSARCWNRYAWDVLVSRYGIERARSMKNNITWIPVRRHEHLERLASELAPEAPVDTDDDDEGDDEENLATHANGANDDEAETDEAVPS